MLSVLLVAGCAPASSQPDAPSEPSPTSAPAVPSSVAIAPSPTRNYHTDVVEYPDGFTPSIEFVDCVQAPDEFVDWMLDPTSAKGRPRRDDVHMPIGAVVTSPSGQWAIFAWSDPSDRGSVPPISKRAYLAPYPLVPETEIISVARVRLDTSETIWGFDTYTSWRGDLQDLGHQGTEAAFTCVG
ncbi:hypothetical protein GCM10009785_19680 [Brooklawnia cerclae]